MNRATQTITPNQTTPRRFILDNVGWMLGSLALAMVIWYVAVSGQDPVEERRFPERLPISYQFDPGLLIVNTPPETAQITIRALQSAWNEIEAENISVVADLVNRTPDTYTIDLKANLSGVPGAVVDVQPRRITVELARKGEKRLSVTVQTAQEPPVGYVLVATTAEDPTILVTGAESSVNKVESVVATVNIGSQRAPFTRRATLSALDAEGKPVTDVVISPNITNVAVDLQQRPDVTDMAVELQFVGTLPDGYFRANYDWNPRRIFVRGDSVAIQRLNGVVPTDPIDLAGRTQTFTQTVRLLLPTGVEMPDPTDISVTVEIKPIPTTREFENIPVLPQGLDPADYNIVVQPDHVNVIVTGPKTLVESLTAADVSVFAPLNGLAGGTHSVSLKVSIARAEQGDVSATIPNNLAEVNIIARNPTTTPTPGPTRTPTLPATATPPTTPTPNG